MSKLNNGYWDEVEEQVRISHSFYPFPHWEYEDKFVEDIMKLAKASYEAGYLDAVDDVKDSLTELEYGLGSKDGDE